MIDKKKIHVLTILFTLLVIWLTVPRKSLATDINDTFWEAYDEQNIDRLNILPWTEQYTLSQLTYVTFFLGIANTKTHNTQRLISYDIFTVFKNYCLRGFVLYRVYFWEKICLTSWLLHHNGRQTRGWSRTEKKNIKQAIYHRYNMGTVQGFRSRLWQMIG